MLAAGDEMGRTQQGNNNAYCQDNELSWVKWDIGAEDRKRSKSSAHSGGATRFSATASAGSVRISRRIGVTALRECPSAA